MSKMNFSSPLSSSSDMLTESLLQSPLTVGLTAVVAGIFSLFVYLVSTQTKIHKQAPAFTSDTHWFFGSLGFTTRPW